MARRAALLCFSLLVSSLSGCPQAPPDYATARGPASSQPSSRPSSQPSSRPSSRSTKPVAATPPTTGVTERPAVTSVLETVKLSLDHAPFDALLRRYVRVDGVDYGAWHQNGVPALDAYLASVRSTKPEALQSRAHKLAFWINAYNAYTVRAVLAAWPGIESVRTVASPDFAFFEVKDKQVGDRRLSLNQIENEVIRPTFKDPRIHAALNCASVSCPPLLAAAFRAETLDAQLDAVMNAFLRDRVRNKISADGLALSALFKWYKEDFAALGGVKAYFTARLDATEGAMLLGRELAYAEYDWTLNKASPR
jgi:hypothetical protein